jgi:mannitol-1-phosphate 5-dehydrogenase
MLKPSSERTFIGFGFGPIQAGLYLYEALRSGNFTRLVVAYRRPEVIAAVRRAGGFFTVNIAHQDRIEWARVGPVEMLDLGEPADREALAWAVAEAEELCTALSSVGDYESDRPASIHRALAEGFRRKAAAGGPNGIIYASENHTEAAEILQRAVLGACAEGEREAVGRHAGFVNTVIGKMSRTVTDPGEIRETGLEPVAPGLERAFLVESYRQILISHVPFEAFRRGLDAFEEKDDLTPFEEAKLYGHNATHALAAYLGHLLGATHIAELQHLPGVLPFLRAAALEESGAALLKRHAGADAMFTPEGYREFTEELISRMFNPYLRDTVERVGRDPARKLGWDDRLVGTMRLCLRRGRDAAASRPRRGCRPDEAGGRRARRLADAAHGADPALERPSPGRPGASGGARAHRARPGGTPALARRERCRPRALKRSGFTTSDTRLPHPPAHARAPRVPRSRSREAPPAGRDAGPSPLAGPREAA